MSRGDKIKAADIMPRHLRRGIEGATSISVPPGATLADTRRQLVLRAFASTNGDYTRTATIVGMTPADVRAEISSLLNGTTSEAPASASMTNGAQRATRPVAEAAPSAGKTAKPAVKAPAGKSKVKKR
jgi:hypothetical protein